VGNNSKLMIIATSGDINIQIELVPEKCLD
jgi:hypothetical protein